MEVNEKLTKQVTEVKYLSVENTERYRPIIRYFFKQYEKLEYWLFKEDVYNALKDNDEFKNYTIDLCEQDLEQLTNWGNLTSFQDTSNVNTLAEFKNRKYRYQLTEYTIEIERMVMRLETLKVESASLEPKLFEKIRLLLEKIKDIENIEELNTCFEDLNDTFTKLNNNYKDFLKMFHEAKSDELMRSEQFIMYKDRVVSYLKDFVAGFQINEIKIKEILKKYPENFEDILIERILFYKKNQPILEPNFDFDYYEEIQRGKWRSIIKWFDNSSLEESETERLKRTISNIINKITKYVVSIVEANRSINRVEEYRHILDLFLNVDDIKESEQLATVIFGIDKVKHLSKIEKDTDSNNVSPKDVTPKVINLKSHSRIIKEKAVKVQVKDKFFEKEKQMKEIEQEMKRKEEILTKYIKKGEIKVSDLDNISMFERRFILSLFTYKKLNQVIKNNEFDVSYKIEKINDEKVQMKSVDGILTMDNIRIVFVGD